jgi:hypothetical protein
MTYKSAMFLYTLYIIYVSLIVSIFYNIATVFSLISNTLFLNGD